MLCARESASQLYCASKLLVPPSLTYCMPKPRSWRFRGVMTGTPARKSGTPHSCEAAGWVLITVEFKPSINFILRSFQVITASTFGKDSPLFLLNVSFAILISLVNKSNSAEVESFGVCKLTMYHLLSGL